MRSEPICVDIQVRWGDLTLQTSRCKPPRTFRVGEDGCDAFVPREYVGADGMPIVLQGPGSMLRAVVLPNAEARIELPGGHVLSTRQAARAGILQPCAEVPGARQLWLHPGVRVTMRLRMRSEAQGPYRHTGDVDRAVEVEIECAEPEAWPRRILKRPPWTFWVSASAALALHIGLMAWIAFAMPSMIASEEWVVDRVEPLLLYSPFISIAEPDEPVEPSTLTTEDFSGGPIADTSLCGDPGLLGRLDSPWTRDMYGLAGPGDNPDPHIARGRGDGTWSEGWFPRFTYGASEHDHVAPWGRDDSLGKDPISARGHLTGRDIGDARGTTGISHQGGGGGGFSLATKRPDACEAAAAAPSTTSLHLGVPSASDPDVTAAVRRIAKANAGRLAHCYEGRTLRGRVVIQATIAASGQVESVNDGGSELGSRDVVQCIVQAFGTLSFPGVTRETVDILYPMVITTGT